LNSKIHIKAYTTGTIIDAGIKDSSGLLRPAITIEILDFYFVMSVLYLREIIKATK